MGVTVVAALEGALVVLVLLFLLAFCVYQLKPEILVRLMTRVELMRASFGRESREVGGYRWSFLVRGGINHKKPTMVFLHGFSSDASECAKVCRYLPHDQHVVAPDLPGHGGTDEIPLSDDVYSSLADKLREFLRLAGLESRPIHLLGASFGGSVALCYTAQHPEDVVALTVICPVVRSPQVTPMMKDGSVLTVTYTEDALRKLFGLLTSTQQIVPPAQILKGILNIRVARKEFHTKLNALVFRSLENLERPLRDAKRVQTATQLIWGEEDQVLHVSGAEPTERALGNACKEKHVWPNCGHVVMWDAPEKFARVVREFQTNHAKATF